MAAIIKMLEQPPLDLLLLADPSAEAVREYAAKGICWGAYEGEDLAGSCILLLTRPKTAEIINLAVYEHARSRGIGTQLLKHAIKYTESSGCLTLEIGTGNSSVQQLGLYQKHGFRITGIDFDYFTRRYPDEICENGIVCRDMIRLSLHF
ncbi:GNAT family N-acetyltransferase [Bacillus sp. UMB0728]|uniref:GNAT family N-acetyltransferase n=1 Tax=Bacillus TaxID=1386 RepID=UPI000C78E582|nr:GNAT family N-acetyltransferase [Bacillus sp. UMB0728]PLR74631.1 GNAT family N-acetyltransferase [Bacillus sp. UMB0728]